MLKITHSLLSSWQYATGDDATPERWESFLSSLKRGKSQDTAAMQDGRQFEFMVNLAACGTDVQCDDKGWADAAKKFGKICKGGTQQVYLEGKRKIKDTQYLLVGVADVIKAGQIFDIKKVQKYEYGKYQLSTQHPMYLELIPEATKFQYLIFDGKMCYNETYRRGDFTPIETTIAQFEVFLKTQGLWNIYTQKWEVKRYGVYSD